jgi:hypothetical protein
VGQFIGIGAHFSPGRYDYAPDSYYFRWEGDLGDVYVTGLTGSPQLSIPNANSAEDASCRSVGPIFFPALLLSSHVHPGIKSITVTALACENTGPPFYQRVKSGSVIASATFTINVAGNPPPPPPPPPQQPPIEQYFVAVGIDDLIPAERRVENGQVAVNIALGQRFSLRLSRSTDSSFRETLPSDFIVENVQLASGVAPNALFGSKVAIEFSESQPASTKHFIAVHLGTARVRLVPTNGQAETINVLLHVVTPSHLGSTHHEVDEIIVPLAHEFGILPQYIKGQMEQESGGMFDPMAYRYEPLAPYTGDYGIISRFGTPKSSEGNYRVREPYRKYSFGEVPGDFLNPSGLPVGSDVRTQDVTPRARYFVLDDGVSRRLGETLSAPDDHVSMRRILLANPGQNWHVDSSNFLPVFRLLQKIGPEESSTVNYTAQTALAASYGYMQVMYVTAVDRMKWNGINGHANPSFLFDTPENRANGGGSAHVGVDFLARAFRNENGSITPNLDSKLELENVFMRAWKRYNPLESYEQQVLLKTRNHPVFSSAPVFP